MLTVEIVKSWVGSLANSQGSYGRMYRHLDENDIWEEFVDQLNEANCKDVVDMVMLIEG